MTASEIAIAEKLRQFIRECTGGQYCLRLLRFLGEYPYARFSRLALAHLLDASSGRLNIEIVLGYLMDKGMVRTYIENNVHLYSLTEDGSLNSLAFDMAKLSCREWQVVVRQIYPAPHTMKRSTLLSENLAPQLSFQYGSRT